MIHFDFNGSRGFRGIIKWFSNPSVHQVYHSMVYHQMNEVYQMCTQYIILIRSSKIAEESFLQCISDINVGREGQPVRPNMPVQPMELKIFRFPHFSCCAKIHVQSRLDHNRIFSLLGTAAEWVSQIL